MYVYSIYTLKAHRNELYRFLIIENSYLRYFEFYFIPTYRISPLTITANLYFRKRYHKRCRPYQLKLAKIKYVQCKVKYVLKSQCILNHADQYLGTVEFQWGLNEILHWAIVWPLWLLHCWYTVVRKSDIRSKISNCIRDFLKLLTNFENPSCGRSWTRDPIWSQ